MRASGSVPRALVAAVVVSLCSCQAVLGFEDFEAGGAGGAGAAGSGGGGGSSGSGNGGAGATSGGDVGVACTTADDCSGDHTCLYGFCRPPCTTDNECAQESHCLFDGNSGGCRLASETCDTGTCVNGDLVCGIDGTCRVACAATCESPTQRCIASTCVSTQGEGSQDWDCGGAADGVVVCDGATLQVCNAIAPGLATIEECNSAGLCANSVPPDETYDAGSPPACDPGCSPSTQYCDGATLHTCREDGSGPVDAGEQCASDALCEGSVGASSPAACVAPLCNANDVRCAGLQTEVVVQTCSDDLTKWDDAAICTSGTSQCNPGGTTCFDLDIDTHEVTMAQYNGWLAGSPDINAQPQGCGWNTTFDIDAACASGLTPTTPCIGGDCNKPVVCIDWCDAHQYCAAQGRRLCGRIAGGMNPYGDYANPGASQWMNACSAGGQYEWGSGDAPATGAEECTYSGTTIGQSYPVGDRALCHSPSPGYESYFDLSGNVEEWEDSCLLDVGAGSAGANDACRTRGGSFETTRNDTRCDAVPASAKVRSDTSPSLGFRCCALPP